MDITIFPQRLQGQIKAIPSKSHAHRVLICAAFADSETQITCPDTNQDIEATAGCLRALGAKIQRTATGYSVCPISDLPESAELNCAESGSTLRFMLPVVAALGVTATFVMEGRLPQRPLSPLWEELERKGCYLSRPTENTLLCQGKLTGGEFSIAGNISSQYITGLLFAMALIPEHNKLNITGNIESRPYIDITINTLNSFGVCADNFEIDGCFPFSSPENVVVEGDWSNAAFFLAAESLGNKIHLTGVDLSSSQGDRAILENLSMLSRFCTIDAADIPDLVPILAVTAGAKQGAKFINIGRLRLKESDRVESVASMLRRLGAQVETTADTLLVMPAKYRGCTIDSVADHRIAMAAAIAATVAEGPVTILGANCVAKSYPTFWDEYKRLGGHYEQYIR